MNIVRFDYNGKMGYGILQENKLCVIESSIFQENIKHGDIYIDVNKVKLLAPISPSKIVCIGLNYKDHAEELNMKIPQEPVIFLKPPTSVIGPGDDISYPEGVSRLDYEAELAIVIKKITRQVPIGDVLSHILGYTCLNDVTARDLQQKDIQWTRAKSFDTFCPIGPLISTDVNPSNLDIRCLVNKKRRQSSNTDNLIFPVEFLVSFVSGIMTLLPGDIIATGTPNGVGPLLKGDEVEVYIEGIGSLKNRVA